MENHELSLLNYYIPLGARYPDRTVNGRVVLGDRVPSPCPELYPRAIHLDGSNWIIKTNLIPWNLLNGIVSAGGKFWTYKFDPSEQQKLMSDAVESIKREIVEATERLNESLTRMDEKDVADPAVTFQERNKRLTQRKQIVKRLTELTKKLEKACKEYGIDLKQQLENARLFADGLTINNYSRAAAMATLTSLATGTQMEDAAKADEVSPGVLADYIEDNGGDATAARVAFRQITTTAQDVIHNAVETSPQQEVIEEDEDQGETSMPRQPVVEYEVTYARLSDGSWGVRSTREDVGVGHYVIAVRSTGQSQRVRITGLDRRFRNGVSLWTFASANPVPVSVPVPVPTQLQDADASPGEERAEPAATTSKPDVTTVTLVKGAWSVIYSINCKKATVTRAFQSETQETLEMSREEAQHHYRATEAQGYKKF
jgi:hypothetical protein